MNIQAYAIGFTASLVHGAQYTGASVTYRDGGGGEAGRIFSLKGHMEGVSAQRRGDSQQVIYEL